MNLKKSSTLLAIFVVAFSVFYYLNNENKSKPTKNSGLNLADLIQLSKKDSSVSAGVATAGISPVSSAPQPTSSSPLLSLAGYVSTEANPAIGKIEQFPVAAASGTVILVPQQHQSPGSEAGDPVNDLAQTTQNQIYQIISELNSKLNINFIMAEGDMYGVVADKKITYLSNLIKLRNQLAVQIDRYKTDPQNQSNPQVLAQVTSDLQAYLNSLDREIALAGAAYKLKAEGRPVTLYGTENQATYDESANLVRDYTYLQDRQKQLTAGPEKTNQTGGNSLIQAYLALLGKQNDPAQNVQRDLAYLNGKNLTSSSTLQALEISFASINKLKNANVVSISSLPARTDNPYNNINSKKQIDSLVAKDETKIQSLIIDRRNTETAANCADALKAQNQSTMILQFGAGHESGLVKELNAQGLSVVVVTPRALVNKV